MILKTCPICRKVKKDPPKLPPMNFFRVPSGIHKGMMVCDKTCYQELTTHPYWKKMGGNSMPLSGVDPNEQDPSQPA